MNTDTENRELLLESYSFTADNGKKYYVRPASFKEVLSGYITEKLNFIGIPKLDKSSRMYFLSVIENENKRQVLAELINRYVTLDGNAVTLDNSDFTVDDLLVLITKIAGISG